MHLNQNVLIPNLLLVTAVSLLICSGCASFDMKKLTKPFLGGSNQEEWEDDVDAFDPLQRKVSDRITLSDLGPGHFGTTLKAKTVGKVDRGRADAEFRKGRDAYARATELMSSNPDSDFKSVFLEAANHFKMASAYWPDSVLDQDSLYYQGESYFFADCYTQSNRAFELLLARYSGSNYLDKAESRRFAIAQYWMQLSEKENPWTLGFKFGDPQRPTSGLVSEARRILHRIRLDDPTGKLADDATMALANSYFVSKRYQDAADTYEDLRNAYPASKHQFDAHFFELKSRLAAYYGESYDGEPLIKAEKLLKSILRQFPNEAQQHEEYLAIEGARVRDLMAQRDWKMAEYFKARGENRAAQVYYQQVAENYDDTKFAQAAQEQIAKISSLPPEPTEIAPFLQKMFPDAAEVKPLIARGENHSIIR